MYNHGHQDSCAQMGQLAGCCDSQRRGVEGGASRPSEEASKEGLRENDEVEVVIRKALDIRELFGKYKFRDLQKLKEELREGWA